LSGILNLEVGTTPATYSDAFPGTGGDEFWTATVYAAGASEYWTVNFNFGTVSSAEAADNVLKYLRCVRDFSYADETMEFEIADDDSDRIVIDNVTGLMWTGCMGGKSGADCEEGTANYWTWEGALNFCESFEGGGYTDWHLADRNEIQSIIDYSKSSGVLDDTAFKIVTGSPFWISTSGDWANYAWAVDFADGTIYSRHKTYGSYMLCVR
jgi:hypothetical protein